MIGNCNIRVDPTHFVQSGDCTFGVKAAENSLRDFEGFAINTERSDNSKHPLAGKSPAFEAKYKVFQIG